MRIELRPLLFIGALALGCTASRPPSGPIAASAEAPTTQASLPELAQLDHLTDPKGRSVALFTEVNRVLTHPRCLNCHPSGDSPLQGMDSHLHDPPVTRGHDDHGVVGMQCTTCHQEQNVTLTRVPGAPKWHVAPIEMAWVGKTPREICEQLKDPARNGGKTLHEIVEHIAHDELVAWGWAPGAGREPAPGTQRRAGELAAAWVAAGAHCPEGTP